MEKKRLYLVMCVVALILFIAGTSRADTPAPPVNQQVGIDDGIFNNLGASECRACHDDPSIAGDPSNVNRHHLLYGTPLPQGECSVNGSVCLSDGDCDPGICSNSVPAVDCVLDDDCPNVVLGEFCGEVCIGATAAPNTDTNNDGIPDTVYGCLSCHEQSNVGGTIQFLVERDCLQCHVQLPGAGSVHHLTGTAQGTDSPLGDPAVGDCTPCHGDLVDDIGDGHEIPVYDPSLMTPEPATRTCLASGDRCSGDSDCPPGDTCTGRAAPGGCNYCHDQGTDAVSGVVVFTNDDTHHNTGVYQSETGVIDDTKCFWCHNFLVPAEYDIRTCEGCHGYASLHKIQVDSDTGCTYDPSDPSACNVVVGGEAAGYGHVGADDPTGDSDCWGCHGFSAAAATGAGPVTPFIERISPQVLTAGKDTVVTLSGTAFTNMAGTYQWVAEVVLQASDGSSVVLNPLTLDPAVLTVAIPGTTLPGNYEVRAVKSNAVISAESNPVVITIKPMVVIMSSACDEGTKTLFFSGSGFGDTPPEGAEQYLNVAMGGVPRNILSWTDTGIAASISSCQGTATVNALFGSARYCIGDRLCGSDCDNDGRVNLDDFKIIKTEFFRDDCDTTPCQADINNDSTVNLSDLAVMKGEYFRTDCCQ